MMAGAAGYAVSNLLGFSYITGPAVRSRIYSAYKIDLAIIAGVIASIWIFFWVGVLLLIGVMLLVHSTGIPVLEQISPLLQRSIAVVILVSVTGILFALSRGVRTLKLRSISLPLPGFRSALYLIAIGMIDITASALALYVLLPADVASSFPLYFVVYVGAIALGIASHSPGGLGVFEATIIAGLGATGRSDVLAALVFYRVIYYVLPFAIAAFSLGIAWGLTNRKKVGSMGKQVHAIIGTMIPVIASALALIAGVILLLSGNLPGESDRLTSLESVVPLPVIEISHLLASIIGVMLIVLARGLYRKQFNAWIFAVCLSCAGIVLSLSKGFDWEEALALVFTMSVLLMFRSAFYRSADQAVFLLSPRWALVSVGVFALSVWVGLFAYSHVEYNNDLWWHFAWNGDAPRYLRASFASGVVLVAIGLNSFFNASGQRSPAEPVPDSVR